jgi:multidrug efflux pump subunit AcrA (membrane-fusion protein)
MRKLSGNRMLAILLTGLAILTAWPARASGPQFVPPRIATASDIPYPVNTATPGIVTLLLNLDVAGKVLNV